MLEIEDFLKSSSSRSRTRQAKPDHAVPAKLTAFQLDIPTTETQYNKNGDPSGEKDLTVDALKEEILVNSGEDTLLILPEAKRLTTSIRYWDEDGNLMSIKKAFSYVEVENVIKKVGEC